MAKFAQQLAEQNPVGKVIQVRQLACMYPELPTWIDLAFTATGACMAQKQLLVVFFSAAYADLHVVRYLVKLCLVSSPA